MDSILQANNDIVAAANDHAPAATSPPAGPIDSAREALGELVALSAACAAREVEIEQAGHASAEQAAREHARARSNAELAAKSLHAEIEQKWQARTDQITQAFDAQLSELKAEDAQRRRKAAESYERTAADAQSKQQQGVWLAESVFEGTQNQLREQSKKAKEILENQLAALTEMEQQAEQRVAKYRQSPPPYLETDSKPPQEQQTPASAGTYEQFLTEAQAHLNHFRHLGLPSLFSGITPVLIVPVICAVAVIIGIWLSAGHPATNAEIQAMTIRPNVVIISLLAGLAFSGLLGWLLYSLARSQVRSSYLPLRRSISNARSAARAAAKDASSKRDDARAKATLKRNTEIETVKQQFAPYLDRARKNRDAALQVIQGEHDRRLQRLSASRDRQIEEVNAWRHQHAESADQKLAQELHEAQRRFDALSLEAHQHREQDAAALRRQWHEGLSRIQAPLAEQARSQGGSIRLDRWDDPRWKNWSPPKDFISRIRFGELRVDLKQITNQYPRTLELPKTFAVPAALTLPRHASLMVHFDKGGRQTALATLQTAMLRLLTSLPPGRVRFTLIDPVGLGQNFAGFMHLADHDEALVGARIWTEAEHIDQRLADLTEHMETVIQKYLRNEFQTIDDYNAQAGELAEPYRFLVIADLPVNFSQESIRRLASIASTGARCGVYLLISRDLRLPIPGGAHLDEIESHSINLVQQADGSFQWNDEVFKRFPLTLDAPPPEEFLTRILEIVGRGAKEAKRVEVPFATIAPAEEKIWSASSSSELSVPVGRAGATRLQSIKLGRGVAQHALIAGKTGSGKSTLLHALVTNTAMWYSPDEVEFYLVDFKKGVEFKTYASNELPHARAIAVESDREFGLSVLQRIDAELARRGEIYRRLGVQDLASYRTAAAQAANSSLPTLPRVLLIIDEFQEFFSEDDKLAQDAATLIDRLVRQGRAFGIHVLLGSQTIGGTSGLSRSTIGQMAIRIALQTSEADSQLILGDNNSAARLLSRPGEAIYNDAGGLVEGNSPFQVAWLPDEQRDAFLQTVREKYQGNGRASAGWHEPAIVFEGNAPADITKNRRLAAALGAVGATPASPISTAPKAWLGDPVAIKDPTAVTFRRQAGANVLIIGQQEESAMALLASSIESLAAQSPKARFIVLDGSASDSPLAQVMPALKDALPPDALKLVEYRAAEGAIAELHEQLLRRQSEAHGAAQEGPLFLLIYGLQRYRSLRKQEESFSFGSSDEEKKPQADKQFAEIIRDGPSAGIHVIAWCDTAAALDRTLDRTAMREFDNRVLFQMSASDSSNLIDAPTANKLGPHRALLYSEEQGIGEKFRPYALPSPRWLAHLKQQLESRSHTTR